MSAGASQALFERGVLIVPDAYLNAGGVTVSYFEWLKDLSHVRFGRMEKRFEESAFKRILEEVGKATGVSFPPETVQYATHGADEHELVHSGLEETMIKAYQDIRDIKIRLGKGVDLRSASFVDAIDKIALCYGDMGIFP